MRSCRANGSRGAQRRVQGSSRLPGWQARACRKERARSARERVKRRPHDDAAV
ncbi:hypothetical protein BURMUCF2_A1247 [Burkholderia multivorans CF2]|nr:hypothetical protein BURMUCF2_A1247 [Burkholderia multivorans CF2]